MNKSRQKAGFQPAGMQEFDLPFSLLRLWQIAKWSLTKFKLKLKNFEIKFLFAMLACSSSVFSQNKDILLNIEQLKTRKENVIKTGIFAPLWGAIPLTSEYRLVYEAPTSMRTSIQIGGSYLGKNFWIWPLIIDSLKQNNPIATQITTKGFRAQIAFKYYLFKDQISPDGLYIAPFLSYSSVKFGSAYTNVYQSYLRAVYMNANLIMGYQFFYMNELAIDFYFGMGYRKNSWVIYELGQQNKILNENDFQLWPWPVKIVLGINVGITY